jgi:site-specific DNA recombinase
MKALIYCRVSTKEQAQNLSLSTQGKLCTEYCIKHGYEVGQTFVDEGESAKTAERPEFLKLFKYCQNNKGKIQTVVVYSLSRFSRNTSDHFALRTLLGGLGITLRSVTEPINESSTGKLMEAILAGVAQFDNSIRAERTIAGMKTAIEKGRWTFQAPLGYLNTADSAGKPSLIPDQQRGLLITKAFELYGTGQYSKNDVLKMVTNMGLLSRKGKKISAQTFGSILRNRIYAGWVSVPTWNASRRGSFEPLVGQEVFDRVQSMLAGKQLSSIPHVRNHPDFPLRRFTRCKTCGNPLTGSWSKGRTKKYPYYRCTDRSCRSVNIRKEDMEKQFRLFLEKLQPNPEYIRLFSEIVLEVWKSKQADVLLQRTALEKRCMEINERKEQLIQAFIYEKAIDKTIFQEQLDKLKEETTLTEIHLNELKREELDVEAVLSFSEYLLLNAARLWAEASLDRKQRLQMVLFPDGVTFGAGDFGTAETCRAFNLLERPAPLKDGLVSPTGFEPVLPA